MEVLTAIRSVGWTSFALGVGATVRCPCSRGRFEGTSGCRGVADGVRGALEPVGEAPDSRALSETSGVAATLG